MKFLESNFFWFLGGGCLFKAAPFFIDFCKILERETVNIATFY